MATATDPVPTEPALVVLAWGNESRGDDGAGPALARRLLALDLPDLVVIEDMQLQIEHVTDLIAGVPALFIDASVAIARGIALTPIAPCRDPSVTTHAVSPQALLQLFETATGHRAPPAWQLHVAGCEFELGAAPGPVNRAAMASAWRLLSRLLAAAPQHWRHGLAHHAVAATVERAAATGQGQPSGA